MSALSLLFLVTSFRVGRLSKIVSIARIFQAVGADVGENKPIAIAPSNDPIPPPHIISPVACLLHWFGTRSSANVGRPETICAAPHPQSSLRID